MLTYTWLRTKLLILDSGLVTKYRFYEQDPYVCILLPGKDFFRIADHIDQLRLSAFQQISPGVTLLTDLDGRDSFYWHVLIVHKKTYSICAAQRLRFSEQDQNWNSETSYLEYSYPGIVDSLKGSIQPFVEVGRVFVVNQETNDHRLLPLLLKLSSLLARHLQHRYILGLMSYVYVSESDIGNILFLRLVQDMIDDLEPGIPSPRHQSILSRIRPEELRYETPGSISLDPSDLSSVVRAVQALLSDRLPISERPFHFTIPPFLHLHSRLSRAVPIGLSEALGYNQIHEILMRTDLLAHSKGAHHPCIVSEKLNVNMMIC